MTTALRTFAAVLVLSLSCVDARDRCQSPTGRAVWSDDCAHGCCDSDLRCGSKSLCDTHFKYGMIFLGGGLLLACGLGIACIFMWRQKQKKRLQYQQQNGGAFVPLVAGQPAPYQQGQPGYYPPANFGPPMPYQQYPPPMTGYPAAYPAPVMGQPMPVDGQQPMPMPAGPQPVDEYSQPSAPPQSMSGPPPVSAPSGPPPPGCSPAGYPPPPPNTGNPLGQ